MERTAVQWFLARVGALLVAAMIACAQPIAAGQPYDAIIQAGHQGRPQDCVSRGGPESERLCHNTGASVPPGEIVWTPIVADEVARMLRAHGVRVLRLPAYVHGTYHTRIAVFIHFDGSPTPCSSGASVAYPPGNRTDMQLADAWKALWSRYWPYRFMHDDFTDTERDYYAYHHIDATDGEFLIEGGEMSCKAQYAWLSSHLQFEARLLAYFIDRRLGRSDIARP